MLASCPQLAQVSSAANAVTAESHRLTTDTPNKIFNARVELTKPDDLARSKTPDRDWRWSGMVGAVRWSSASISRMFIWLFLIKASPNATTHGSGQPREIPGHRRLEVVKKWRRGVDGE